MSKLFLNIIILSVFIFIGAGQSWGCCCCASPLENQERDAAGLVTRTYFDDRMRDVIPLSGNPEKGKIECVGKSGGVLCEYSMGVDRITGKLTIGGAGLRTTMSKALEDTFLSVELMRKTQDIFTERGMSWDSYTRRFDDTIKVKTNSIDAQIQASHERFIRYCEEAVLVCALEYRSKLADFLLKTPDKQVEWLESTEAKGIRNELVHPFLEKFTHDALQYILHHLKTEATSVASS